MLFFGKWRNKIARSGQTKTEKYGQDCYQHHLFSFEDSKKGRF